MALDLASIKMSFSICQSSDCKTLTFKDTTGSKNANNTTGYTTDALNHDVKTTLTVTLPDGTLKELDLTADGYITTDVDQAYEITSYTLGLTNVLDPIEALPDGIYILKYKVFFDDGTSLFVTKKITIYCQIKCCVMNLFSEIADNSYACNSKEVSDALFAFALLQDLIYESGCDGNSVRIKSLIESLQRLCELKDCNCGCNK